VTLRGRTVQQVLATVARAGLTRVEWGADGHVPPGDVRTASRARAAGRDLGVEVASYGSYFRAGPHEADGFVDVLAAAVALGAPRIRIWAGDVGSAAATAQQRRAVAEVTRAVAVQAADAGTRVAFEYHADTLTDTAESTLRLLADVDHPQVGTYWQPPVDASDADALHGLAQVLPWVAAVHVFSWWPGERRLALTAREPLWARVFDLLRGTGRSYDALLEFVADDALDNVVADAAALVRLAAAPARRTWRGTDRGAR
jgi:hypothetical protein